MPANSRKPASEPVSACPLFSQPIALCSVAQYGASGAQASRLCPDLLLSIAGVGYYLLDLAKDQIHGDARYLRLLGYPPHPQLLLVDEVLGILDEAGRTCYRDTLAAIRAGERDRFELCFSVRPGLDGGERLAVLDRGQVCPQCEGDIIAGSWVDVTRLVARKRTGAHAASLADQDTLDLPDHRTSLVTGVDPVQHHKPGTDSQKLSLAVLVQDAVRMARVLPVFQPLIRLHDRAPVAEEAFARILESDKRILHAGAFIEVARQLRLLHRIDHMLFDAARERLEHPPLKSAGIRSERGLLPVFVHISADLLQHSNTHNQMLSALEAQPLPAAGSMVLVLHEDVLVDLPRQAVTDALDPLLELGCRLSIAGYSGQAGSLAFLDTLPVEYLTLDPALVERALYDEPARLMIGRIQRRARSAGITLIAKQVQNPHILELVTELGLDWAQGYLLGVPSDPAWPLSAREPQDQHEAARKRSSSTAARAR
jgi:EAL domain-containing protein (putative c-di-GMP-specific phosphodiesterase class I)